MRLLEKVDPLGSQGPSGLYALALLKSGSRLRNLAATVAISKLNMSCTNVVGHKWMQWRVDLLRINALGWEVLPLRCIFLNWTGRICNRC